MLKNKYNYFVKIQKKNNVKDVQNYKPESEKMLFKEKSPEETSSDFPSNNDDTKKNEENDNEKICAICMTNLDSDTSEIPFDEKIKDRP